MDPIERAGSLPLPSVRSVFSQFHLHVFRIDKMFNSTRILARYSNHWSISALPFVQFARLIHNFVQNCNDKQIVPFLLIHSQRSVIFEAKLFHKFIVLFVRHQIILVFCFESNGGKYLVSGPDPIPLYIKYLNKMQIQYRRI